MPAFFSARSIRRAVCPSPSPGAAVGFEPFAVEYPEGSDVGYRWYEREDHRPLFPFGHGLSYSRFEYSDLKVEGGDSLRVTFRVSNVGDREGADVPQLYVAREGQQARRLAGWRRVSLRPGESREVVITAEPRILAEYETTAPGWRIAAGTYRVQIGRDALDNALGGEADLSSQTIRP